MGLAGFVLLACASQTEPQCDFTGDVIVDDARPGDACEVLITRPSRSLRIEVPGAGSCTAAGCSVSCDSPDLKMSFAWCYRGPNGGKLGFRWTAESGAAVRNWFNAGRGDMANVDVTCGGSFVTSTKLGLCGVAL